MRTSAFLTCNGGVQILPDYFAHTSTDGRRQLLTDHLQNVGDLAADFAERFIQRILPAFLPACMMWARAARFYRRLFLDGPKVDHSTLGAQLLYQRNMEALAYICAGHHGGLLDYGTTISINNACLAKRLQRKWILARLNCLHGWGQIRCRISPSKTARQRYLCACVLDSDVIFLCGGC